MLTRQEAGIHTAQTHTHTIHSHTHTLRGSSEVKVHLFVFMEETTHLGIEPATFQVNPVIAASSRVHTEPETNVSWI